MERIELESLELNPFEVIRDDNFLITAGDMANFNTMTAGWGGLGYVWGKPVVFIFVRESRYTLEFLEKYDNFSVSFFPHDYSSVLDFCGSNSGRSVDKIKETGLTPIAVDSSVAFEEANLVFSCKKIGRSFMSKQTILDPSCLTHYPQGDYHYMYIGEIEGVYIN